MPIGFGLERLGLLTLRIPRIVALLVIAFTAFCGYQVTKFSIDGDLLRLYRGSGAEFDRYMALGETFGTFENDVYILVSSPDLADPDVIEELRFLAFEVELEMFAAGTLSPFSLRKPVGGGTTVPAVPEAMTSRAEVDAELTNLRETDPLMRNLIMADNQGVVMIMFPDADMVREHGEAAMVASLRSLVSNYESDNIQIELTGPPVWKGEMLQAALSDQFMFMGTGILLGFLTALLAFRTFWGALLATLAPAVTALWVTGTITTVFGAFTFLTNIISALILVIAFAESMYFCFYWLRLWQDGADPRKALTETVRKVSPACALTAITTIVAFLTLTLAPGQGLREFAISGAIGMGIAFVALVTFLPLSLLAALRLGYSTTRPPSIALTAPIPLTRRFARYAPRRIAIISLMFSLALLVPHFLLEPRFSFADFLPRGSESVETSDLIDEGVGGVAPVYIKVPLSGGLSEMSDGDFELIERAHTLAEEHFGKGKVISAASFRHYSDSGFSRQQIMGAVGPFMQRRFVTDDSSAALITAFSPTSEDASQTQDVIEALRADLAEAGLADAEISGFRVLTAYASISMIWTLQQSLGLAVLLSVLLIGIAFRSWKVALVSLIPNALPILLTELFLYSSGIQLQLTTVISLTVAFGIAVDDTIHFLAHYTRARERGASIPEAVDSTLDRVGPALIATTLILVAGCAVLMVSALPQVALFGFLTVITLLSALLGDLIVLPALLIGGGRIFERRSGTYNEANA